MRKSRNSGSVGGRGEESAASKSSGLEGGDTGYSQAKSYRFPKVFRFRLGPSAAGTLPLRQARA